jgi:hypothetical protein
MQANAADVLTLDGEHAMTENKLRKWCEAKLRTIIPERWLVGVKSAIHSQEQP